MQVDQINLRNHQEVGGFHEVRFMKLPSRRDVQSRSFGPDPESCALLLEGPRTLARTTLDRVLFSSPAASSAFFWKSLNRAKTPLFQRAATSAASSRRPSTAQPWHYAVGAVLGLGSISTDI